MVTDFSSVWPLRKQGGLGKSAVGIAGQMQEKGKTRQPRGDLTQPTAGNHPTAAAQQTGRM